MVIETGEVKTYASMTAAIADGMNSQQAAAEAFPGTFIKLTISNKTDDKLFINVSSLIAYVTSSSTASDMVVVNVYADHKVIATLTDGAITLAKLEADVQTKINQAHSHLNKTVLDGITSAKVSAWDAKQDALQFMTAPSDTNKAATKADLDAVTLVWSQLTV